MISMWRHILFSQQICPSDTLACCWDVRQATTNNQHPQPWNKIVPTRVLAGVQFTAPHQLLHLRCRLCTHLLTYTIRPNHRPTDCATHLLTYTIRPNHRPTDCATHLLTYTIRPNQSSSRATSSHPLAIVILCRNGRQLTKQQL